MSDDVAVVREARGVSDAVLSQHVEVLTDSGFVTVRKSASESRTDSRRIASLSLTNNEKAAFDADVRALREIAAEG